MTTRTKQPTQQEQSESLVEVIKSKKLIKRVLASVEQDEQYMMPHGIRKELDRMAITIKALRGKQAEKSKNKYEIVFPRTEKRADLTDLNEFIERGIACRERLAQIYGELTDLKRDLDFASEDCEEFIYSKFSEQMNGFRTDTMRRSVVMAITRPIDKRQRIVSDMLELVEYHKWTIQAVMSGIEMIINATRSAGAPNPDQD